METPFIDGNRIISCRWVGLQEVYDFEVEEHHNYIASGLIHHNTEGAGGYETTVHLTGRYPAWWSGRTWDRPVRFWAAGKTNETTRDIVQQKLFGQVMFANGRKTVSGTGLIPGEDIVSVTWKQGVQDLVDTAKIRHRAGGFSVLRLKSYEQGRGSFEGTEQDGIWLDEEPPADVYGECLIRTATTDGLIYLTFTPLEGMSDTVLSFLPGGKLPKAEGFDA